jgi:hypothetical protein
MLSLLISEVVRGLTNSVYLTLLQRWTNGAVVHGVR